MILPPIALAALVFCLLELGFTLLLHHLGDPIPIGSLPFGYLPSFMAVVATAIVLLVDWTVQTVCQEDSLSPKQKSHSGVSHET
jgi:hypothetical protein